MAGRRDEATSSNRFIEEQLDKCLQDIGNHLDSDLITIVAPMFSGIDEMVRDQVEFIAEDHQRKSKLAVFLVTEGGSIEVVERIAEMFRHHYPEDVAFYIPSFAMSAGTVLAMSGNSIHMDYFSVLGPIDPQVRRSSSENYVPALGYLEKYDEFIEKSSRGELTQAEVMFFLQKFDPAELHTFEQARSLSEELLKRWLVRYKFSNWTVTQTTNIPVTDEMKEERAAEIASKLNDVKRWKTHSRALTRQVIEHELNLLIDDFGVDGELSKLIRTYYRLLQDYMLRMGQSVVVHVPNAYEGM